MLIDSVIVPPKQPTVCSAEIGWCKPLTPNPFSLFSQPAAKITVTCQCGKSLSQAGNDRRLIIGRNQPAVLTVN
jgi:hypothetical protein